MYHIFSKIILIKKYKIKFRKNDNLIEPDYADLLNLFNNVKKIKPKYILELGGGYSTVALASAARYLKLKKNINCKIISIDQSEKYLEYNKQLLSNELKNYVDFFYRPLIIKKINNIKVSHYQNIPKYNYQFLYEDRHDHEETTIAGDIYLLEDQTTSLSFCIDGMWDTVNFLKKNLKKQYHVEGGFLHGTNFIIKKIVK